MRCFTTLLALAAAFTIVFSPRLNRWLWYHIPPATPADYAGPRYKIGDRYVTAEEFTERTPA